MMTNRMILTITLGVLIKSQVIKAQSLENNFTNNIIPPSPQAAAIEKYGEYPVSLYTGLVDISIPVYTVESDGFKIPLELKYHASGIRYDDETGAFGLGWTLMGGGQISMTIMGQPDFGGSGDSYNFYRNAADVDPSSDCASGTGDNRTLLGMVLPFWSDGWVIPKDGEYDIFNYSFLNRNGKFIFPLDENDPLLIPKKPLKINKYKEDNRVSYIDVIDENGVFYRFGKSLKTGNYALEVPFISPNPTSSDFSKTFLLTEVVSADKSDTVFFEYNVSSTRQSRFTIDDRIDVYDALEIYFSPYYPSNEIERYATRGWDLEYKYHLLSAIKHKSGKITFEYNAQNLATSIKIWDKIQTDPLRTILLFQTQFGSAEYNKLDSVRVLNEDSDVHRYTFSYNATPYAKINSSFDYWGYCNGTYSGNLVPNFNITYRGQGGIGQISIGGSSRNANESLMQLGVLNKITYPTGGFSRFLYKAHRNENGEIEGGLRIDEIRNYNSDGTFIGKKWYKYGEGESGNGRSTKPAVGMAENFCTTIEDVGLINIGNGPELSYKRRVRSYSVFPKISYLPSGSSVVYSTVTEYTGDVNSNSNGKTVYHFSDEMDAPGFIFPTGSSDRLLYSNTWRSGQLLSKTIYKKEGSQFIQVFRESNDYLIIDSEEWLNLRVIPFIWITNYGGAVQKIDMDNARLCYDVFVPFSVSPVTSMVGYGNYYTCSGQVVLSKSEKTYFEQGNTITSIINYDNYNAYGMPREIRKVQSDGAVFKSLISYPPEMTDDVSVAMVTKHIVSPVIEQTEYKGTSFLQSVKTNYGYFQGNTIIAPSFMETKNGLSSKETRIIFHNYDNKGNLLCASKTNDINETYLWGYNQTLPVAKFDNITYSSVSSNSTLMNYVNQLQNYTVLTNPTVRNNLKILNDNIRSNLPANVWITTYTYSPLVGMTSQTDPKGVTTYYEYDSFGRLKCTKDDDGNILKQYDYHYTNQ